jgi:uncharacterized ferritin-like protein (DUF455 family)
MPRRAGYHAAVTSLRPQALQIVLQADPDLKAAAARALDAQGPLDTAAVLVAPEGIPGRPARPELVPYTAVKPRPMHTVEGRAALIHALAHIELNAIDLALDIVWRFAGMPEAFYRQWVGVAKEEALHFELLREHLHTLGFAYGDFPAHQALWNMAEKTQHDLLALEARGLDASPPIKAKLVAAGDQRAGAILDIILRDEIGHVAIGNHWYRHLCAERGLDPLSTYAELAELYRAPRLRGPFNLEARRAAGFSDEEMALFV